MKVVSQRREDQDSDEADQDDFVPASPDLRTGFFCFYTNHGFCSVCGRSANGFLETLPFTFKQRLLSIGGLEEVYQSYYAPVFTC